MNNRKEQLEKSMQQHLKNAFSGNAQNIQAWDMAQLDEKELRHLELEILQERKKRLEDRIRSQEAQDENAMMELDQVLEDIEDLEKYIKNYGLSQGGRRKRNRQTKRRSKNRAKSRRSKH